MNNVDPVQLFLALAFVAFLLFLIGHIFVRPLRWLLRLGYSSLLGLILLWAINFLGNWINFMVPINPVTVLTVGFLGLPGLILLVVLKLVMP